MVALPTFARGLAAIGLGLASLAVTAFIEQRWEVTRELALRQPVLYLVESTALSELAVFIDPR